MSCYLYILKCSDNSLYTGITSNLERRINEHNKGKGGKYTFTRRPVKRVYSEKYPDRSSAMKREAEIKRWPRIKKIELISNKSK